MHEPADALRVHLLGGFRVTIEGRLVHDGDWRLRKTKNLVKLLALAPGHRLHREQLMEVLWPEQDPDAAANNLHKAIYTARRALEPDLSATIASSYLHLQSDSLVLSGPRPLWVDVEVFEQAAANARGSGEPRAYETALEVYSGELLPEDRYEDWAAGRRETLVALYLSLLLELAQVQEARGLAQAAIESLRRIVASDPSNEEARVALMRLHAQTGQRHQALRQYQQLQAALRREVDIEPTPATEQLYQDILAGRWAPAVRPQSELASSARRPAAGATGADAEPAALVGRDAELDILESALDDLFAGRGRLVLLAGEAGIGKSRLAREIVERLRRRGGTALVGAAYEHEGRLPYGPFVEALEPVGGLEAPVGVRAVFGDGANDLARLPESQASAIRSERQRLFAAVTDLLRRLAAASPVLLVLDDLHAADAASLELLHYVARTTRDHAVLVLGTFRAEEAPSGSTLGQLVGALRRDQLAVRLDLERLPHAAIERLVSALVKSGPIDRTIFDVVQQVAAGNPLYTEELLRTLHESGRLQQVDGRWQLRGDSVPLPGPALEMLAARMERLGAVALQVLTVAAVAGQASTYPLLRTVTETPDNALLDALDACLAYSVLNETPEGYRFGHPLQRAALYEKLSRARREHLHGRVAAALEQLHADTLPEHAEELAHHWVASERRVRAVPYLIWAGDRAVAVHANEAAEAAYRRALELLDAPDAPDNRDDTVPRLWEKLGDVRALTGQAGDEAAYAAGADALQQASTLEPERLARLHRKAAYAALARHAVDAATPHLAAAEAILGASRDSAEWPRVRLVRALWFWARGSHDQGQQAAEESVALARERGETLDLVNAYMTLALVFHSSGRWKEGLAVEIANVGRAADADPGLGLLFDAHMCLGEYHLYGDTSFEAVKSYARQMLEQATRAGALRAQALAWLLLGESLLSLGRWNEAADCLHSSLALQRTAGSLAGQALALQRLAELCVYRGDFAAADHYLAEGLGLAVDAPMAPHVYGRLHATAALNALQRGDPQTARRSIEDAAEAARCFGDCSTCSALLHPIATDTYVALGDVTRADYHAQAATQVAAHWESGAWRAMAARANARVVEVQGELARASQRFGEAADVFESIGQPYDSARCLVDAARTATPNVEKQRDLLGRALAIFDALQAEVAADQTRMQLSRL